MKQTGLLLILAVASSSAVAATKCVEEDGSITFTDMDCPAGSKPVGEIEYKAPASPGGLRPGEKRMLQRLEAEKAQDQYERQRAREHSQRHSLSYNDRLRLRELENEKDRLTRALKRGSRTYGDSTVVRERMRGIDREIRQIRSLDW